MSQIGVPVWIGLYRKGQNMSWVDGSELNYICRNYKRKSYEGIYISRHPLLKPFPKQQILDSSKLKDFADDNLKFDENGRNFSKQVENTG